MSRALLVALLISSISAHADDAALTEMQKLQLEQLRAQMASDVQLRAYELLDELVYGRLSNVLAG